MKAALKDSHSKTSGNTFGNVDAVRQYQQTLDPRLLEELIDRNQGLLHRVLRSFSYFPDPYEDLLQVANLGLIKAIQRFDADRGCEFSSYAFAVIDGEVRHYLRDSMLLRQPRWLRKLEQQIDSGAIELARRLKHTPTLAELSEYINISEEGILEVMRAHAAAGLNPLDDNTPESMNPDASRIRSLRYESFCLPVEDRIVIDEALDRLTALQRKIVYRLFYEDRTQQEVAQEMGLSQRKVSRESARALDRLKAILNTRIF